MAGLFLADAGEEGLGVWSEPPQAGEGIKGSRGTAVGSMRIS